MSASAARPGGEAAQGSLFPREHGASMMLLFPLVTAWLLGEPSVASIALGVAAILVFVSHESLLVVAGKRGARRREEVGAEARRWLAVLGGAALVLGGIGLALASPAARLACVVPALLAIPVAFVAAKGRERRTGVELVVAAALSSIVLPLGIAGGLDPAHAGGVALAWWTTFAVGTIAARGVLLQMKDGGKRLAIGRAVALVVLTGALALAVLDPVPPALALAPAPTALGALLVTTRPPSPKHMARVGLGLVATSCMALALLLAAPW